MTLQEWLDNECGEWGDSFKLAHYKWSDEQELYIEFNTGKMDVGWYYMVNLDGYDNELYISEYFNTIKEAKLALLRKYKRLLQNQLDILKDIEL